MAKKWLTLIICFVIIIIVAFLGSLFTSKGTNSAWYQQIKPSITPPNFVFPIAWAILFILIALSLFFAWTNAKNNKEKKMIGWFFGINFILNILWSFLFFSQRLLSWAFIEIIIMWLSIVAMIIFSRKTSKLAAWLLIPYLIWVTFASVLTFMAAFA